MHLTLDVLKSQREAAESAYNEWLTRLDALHKLPVPYERRPELLRALTRLTALISVPPPQAQTYAAPPPQDSSVAIPVPGDIPRDVYPGGVKGRIKEKIRIFVTRLLQIEDRFKAVNSRIEWVNEAGAARDAELRAAAGSLAGALAARDEQVRAAFVRQDEFRAAASTFLNEFAQATHDLSAHIQEIESARVRYFQTIIALIDTKDRELNGLINNHVNTLFAQVNAMHHTLKDLIQNRVELLSGRVDVLLESFDRRLEKMMLQLHESALVRDQMHRELEHEIRREADAVRAAVKDVRLELLTRLSEVSNGLLAVKRHVQTMGEIKPAARHAAAAASAPAAHSRLDDYKYTNFEFRYRGSEELIKKRFTDYVALFDGDGTVLDAGCGRGELLELLTDTKRPCYGIDINDDMVAHCRQKGLRAEVADLVGHLSSLKDGTLGGIFSAQVVEHLQPRYLLQFLELSCAKLHTGGRLVIETINPTSLYAIFEAYYRDLSHVQPIHPDTLKFFAEESGFGDVQIIYRSPVADELKLSGDGENTRKLNRILFGDQDYALVARKL